MSAFTKTEQFQYWFESQDAFCYELYRGDTEGLKNLIDKYTDFENGSKSEAWERLTRMLDGYAGGYVFVKLKKTPTSPNNPSVIYRVPIAGAPAPTAVGSASQLPQGGGMGFDMRSFYEKQFETATNYQSQLMQLNLQLFQTQSELSREKERYSDLKKDKTQIGGIAQISKTVFSDKQMMSNIGLALHNMMNGGTPAVGNTGLQTLTAQINPDGGLTDAMDVGDEAQSKSASFDFSLDQLNNTACEFEGIAQPNLAFAKLADVAKLSNANGIDILLALDKIKEQLISNPAMVKSFFN